MSVQFFISNDTGKLEKAISVATRKGQCVTRKIASGGVNVLIFGDATRAASSKSDNFAQKQRAAIAGFGTFFYKNKYPDECLSEILNDHLSGKEVFSSVRGHFAFVVIDHEKEEVRVITDKVGFLSVYSAHENGSVYVSSSLLMTANAMDSLTVNRQSCLEFIHTEGIYGGETLFNEIRHLKEASTYLVSDSVKHEGVYLDVTATTHSSEWEFHGILDEHFNIFNSPTVATSVDLSGGYDSRTVASIMQAKEQEFLFNTNTNEADPRDHRIALNIAKELGRDIRLYEKRAVGQQIAELSEDCFYMLEGGRNIFRAYYTTTFFEEKAKDAPMILGGYGGELFRDKYYADDIASYINRYLLNRNLTMPRDHLEQYRHLLASKFEVLGQKHGEDSPKRLSERIYYHERMRYWGGSRISAFQQYAYRYHPILDYEVVKYLFDVPREAKKDLRFQRAVIRRFCPVLDGMEVTKRPGIVKAVWRKAIAALFPPTFSYTQAVLAASGRTEDYASRVVPFGLAWLMERKLWTSCGLYMTVNRVLAEYADKIRQL